MKSDISQEDLDHCIVLEVGSGRGDTTRYLAGLLSSHTDNCLIVTDLSDRYFDTIREDIGETNVRMEFHRTSAGDLRTIPDGSVDYLVCNYTLCAVNALPGQLLFALRRFNQVLKPGGVLFIEEEYPLSSACNPAQEVWAEKWRILKAANLIVGEYPYQEIAPEILSELCTLLGFGSCQWEADTTLFAGADGLQFFQARLERLLTHFPGQGLVDGFHAWAAELAEKYTRIGAMEAPYYRFRARKEFSHT